MGKLRGVTVELTERKHTGFDAAGNPVTETKSASVENVLFAPLGALSADEFKAYAGKKGVYVLGIPKGDTHVWTGGEIKLNGRRWSVIGKPVEGIDSLIPLEWNQKVLIAAYPDLKDGLVRFVRELNVSEPGEAPVYDFAPVPNFAEFVPFEYREVESERFWEAKRQNVQIDKMIRIFATNLIFVSDVAVLPDKAKYQIEQIQFPQDVFPKVMDLALRSMNEMR